MAHQYAIQHIFTFMLQLFRLKCFPEKVLHIFVLFVEPNKSKKEFRSRGQNLDKNDLPEEVPQVILQYPYTYLLLAMLSKNTQLSSLIMKPYNP